MKNIALLLLGLFLALPQFAQERKYSTFYEQRATLFEELPVTSRDIIFLGNSITNGCEWGELFQNTYVKNRGISGDICMGGVIARQIVDFDLVGSATTRFVLNGFSPRSTHSTEA